MANRSTRLEQALAKEKCHPAKVRIQIINTDTGEPVEDVDKSWTGQCPDYKKTALGDSDKATAFLNRLQSYRHNHEEIQIEQNVNGTWNIVHGNTLMSTLRK